MNSTDNLAIAIRRTLLTATAAFAIMFEVPPQISRAYEFGFETAPATTDWQDFGGPAGPIVPNGGGALGLTAPQGTHYYEAPNLDDGDFTGYGAGGYSLLGPGGLNSSYTGGFWQAIDIYINPAWSPPAGNPTDNGFVVDDTPGLVTPYASPMQYQDESQLDVRVPSTGTVQFAANGGAAFGSTTAAGWYTFVTTFSKSDSNPTDAVLNSFYVYNTATTQLVGSLLNQPAPGGLENQMLGGPTSHVWITLWQNGFAGDLLGIDDIRTGSLPFFIPEPGSLGLIAIGLAGIAAARMLRRRNA